VSDGARGSEALSVAGGAAPVASPVSTRAENAGRSVLLAGPSSPILRALEREFVPADDRGFFFTEPDPAGHDRVNPAAIVGAAQGRLGGLDVLVRHVPIAPSGPLLEAAGDAWRDAVVLGLVDGFELCRAAAAAMTSGGSIVNVASIDALHAYPGRSAAATVMAGLVGLTRALAVELAARKVRANVVIAGPLAELVHDGVDAGVAERTLDRAPGHRFGTVRELAHAVLFVASPRAGFMTGQTLRVDGGWASLNQAPDGMKFR